MFNAISPLKLKKILSSPSKSINSIDNLSPIVHSIATPILTTTSSPVRTGMLSRDNTGSHRKFKTKLIDNNAFKQQFEELKKYQRIQNNTECNHLKTNNKANDYIDYCNLIISTIYPHKKLIKYLVVFCLFCYSYYIFLRFHSNTNNNTSIIINTEKRLFDYSNYLKVFNDFSPQILTNGLKNKVNIVLQVMNDVSKHNTDVMIGKSKTIDISIRFLMITSKNNNLSIIKTLNINNKLSFILKEFKRLFTYQIILLIQNSYKTMKDLDIYSSRLNNFINPIFNYIQKLINIIYKEIIIDDISRI